MRITLNHATTMEITDQIPTPPILVVDNVAHIYTHDYNYDAVPHVRIKNDKAVYFDIEGIPNVGKI